MTKKQLLFYFLLFYSLTSTNAQVNMDSTIYFSIKQATVTEALDRLSADYDLNIAYSDNFFKKNKRVNLELKAVPISKVLRQILKGTDVSFKIKHQQLILYLDKIAKKKKYTISGYVSAEASGEKLIGVNVHHKPSGKWTTTDVYGFYSLTLTEGERDLTFTYLGCKEKTQPVSLNQSTRKDINLASTVTLSEIIVKPSIDTAAVETLASSGQLIPPNYTTIAPSIGGESDIIGLAKSMPGVQSGADGFGGLYVRGGDAGQNLMLLDGVPIYNPSHLLGIFSVYNSDAVRSAKLLKGQFPARFGGRISSVFDVHTKEGNQKEWNSNIGLGLISGQAMVEGPILKNKGTLLLAARRTHSNFLLSNVFENTLSNQSKDYNFNFYDFNAKLNYQLNKQDKLFLSFYKGKDNFSGNYKIELSDDIGPTLEQESVLKWGNTIAAFRWNRIWGARLFSNTTATFSRYKYQNSSLLSLDNFEFYGYVYGYESEDDLFFFEDKRTDIKDLALKMDFDFIPTPKHYLRFGLSFIKHQFTPHSNSEEFIDPFPIEGDSSLTLDGLTNQYTGVAIPATEFAAYLEDDYKITNNLNLNIGLRGSGFESRDQRFLNLEPRINLTAKFNKKVSSNLSASRMIQYVQQVSTSGLSLPDDLYLPSSKELPPVKSWLIETGINIGISDKFTFSFEAYYKRMTNLLSPIDGEEVEIDNRNSTVEGLSIGEGNAYGLEFMLQKKGKTGGWLSYTFANTNRQSKDQNDGKKYAFQFDQRQNINIFAYHQINSKLNISFNWTFKSGSPELNLTNPSLTQFIDSYGFPLPPNNGNKNNVRTKAYHRLDANLTYQFAIKNTRHTFKIGAYNVYNRKNIAFNRLSLTETSQLTSEPITLLNFTPSLYYQIRF